MPKRVPVSEAPKNAENIGRINQPNRAKKILLYLTLFVMDDKI